MTTTALRPVEPDLVEVLQGAVAQRGTAQQIAAEAVRRQVDRVFFVGVGGSWASSVPVTLDLQHAGLPFPVLNVNASEFTALTLPLVGPTSLVIAASHSGGTPETVEAARLAAARGALVVGVATDTDNPLGEASAFQLSYGSARTVTSSKYVLLSELALALREAHGAPADGIAATRTALEAIPEATLAATLAADDQLAEIARSYGDADNVFVLASGPLTGLAYLLSVCYLVEMQWKKSTHFTTADFFHGPFELATEGQPYILFAGADATRAHTERAQRFLDTHNPEYRVLDATALELPGIAREQLPAVQHIPMASITMRLADHFEAATGHNLDERRYMHRVEY
ncbi:SIS domain-containing protein [Microbacterium aurantiacum]|uniref:SIS domain-containing protein n=1 Tax=Microbacterium aurantiacum TaxID=162393 RepID=UPI001F032607|nr:SIS domain-containing protein [Microbacterium aurantiacum]